MRSWTDYRVKRVLLVLVVLLVLGACHTVLVPSLIGYYGSDCRLSKSSYEAYRLLFSRIVRLYEELDQVYWVDHGLLLGYYRLGDMLPHDGDIDISRIHSTKEHVFDKMFKKKMALFPETMGNSMIAKMNYTGADGEVGSVSADLYRYEEQEVRGKKIIVHYWNAVHKNGTRYRLFDRHFEQNFPYEYIFPLKRSMFLGENVTFPNNIEGLLAMRYPTYKIPLPYKWKCYIPGSQSMFFIACLLLLTIIVVVSCFRRYRAPRLIS